MYNFEDNYECNQCGKEYKTALGLSKHISRVHCVQFEQDTYECNQCGKEYKTALGLSNHISRVHFEYFCDQCGKEYKTALGLTKHISRVHQDTKENAPRMVRRSQRLAEKTVGKNKEKKNHNDDFLIEQKMEIVRVNEGLNEAIYLVHKALEDVNCNYLVRSEMLQRATELLMEAQKYEDEFDPLVVNKYLDDIFEAKCREQEVFEENLKTFQAKCQEVKVQDTNPLEEEEWESLEIDDWIPDPDENFYYDAEFSPATITPKPNDSPKEEDSFSSIWSAENNPYLSPLNTPVKHKEDRERYPPSISCYDLIV
jgi:DNA-directed RNA polymerase subunit RPC12/RpoP